MRYGSVCSGIEAASVAWESLGWKAAWFAEIEAFPSAVLAHHWPEVVNLGDMTKIAVAVRAGEVEAPEIIVGGTPCQAFSVAGLRHGLSDARGQLTLSYVELANDIDDKRLERGEEEAIIVWENVPGVLNTKDNAFGCFLAGLAGESSELQPAGGKWTNAGCVSGPERVIAWRVIDAQFLGVAQRRKRVFVVASARNGFDPAKVLFELESLRRDTPPRRRSQPEITCSAGKRVDGGSHWDNPVNPHPTLNQSNNIGGIGSSNQEVFSQRGAGIVCDSHTSLSYSDVSRTLLGKENDSTAEDLETYAIAFPERMSGTQAASTENLAPAIMSRNPTAIAFSSKDYGADATVDLSPTLRAGNSDTSHANGGQPPAICIQHASIGRKDEAGPQGKGYQEDVAFTQDSRSSSDVIQYGMQVRRLTPRECERLQGFPDDHTLIEYGRKISPKKMDRDFAKYLMRGGKLTFDECCGRAADGPRYKAIGNSMAVPVMRWIGERINAALKVAEPEAPFRTWQRPFLKWAGGKFSLLSELDKHIPAGLRLIEPFVGGGSVFLNSDKHANFLLADINADLINLYQMLAVVPAEVISAAQLMFKHLNTAEDYDAIKAEFNGQLMDATDRAAAFLYLNRHCFNGLMRYNRSNQFNVGFGKYPSPYFPDGELKSFTSMSHNCVFLNAGFRRTLALAGDGDVVYCDPPYEPLPGTNGFTAYTAGGFNWDEQIALAECCVAAYQRGARVVISNSTAPRVIELYEQHGFTLHHVIGRRSISSKGSTRAAAKDLVAIL